MQKSTKRTFWERTKEALQDANLPPTQVKAAEIAGVRQPSVSDWNKPGKAPELENVLRLAKRLDVCVEWLYTERGPKRPGRPDDEYARQLWEIWPSLDDRARMSIVGFALVTIGGAEGTSAPDRVRLSDLKSRDGEPEGTAAGSFR